LDKFLAPKTAEAYYLRSNAITAGLVYEGKPLQGEYIGAFSKDRLVGVVSYTWLNTILVYADDMGCIPELGRALLPFIQKRRGTVEGFLGLVPLANALMRALGIPQNAIIERENDGLYRLKVKELKLPDLLRQPDIAVRRAKASDMELAISWGTSFKIEALHETPGPILNKKVKDEMSHRIDELFVLEKDDQIVSMCTAGGYVPDTIMMGLVWTPSELRGKGYAKAVSAGAIKLVTNERQNLQWAVLTATRPDAIRAYEAIGFKRIADWHLALMKNDFKTSMASTT